ncbi:MAG: insulinase family protein [Bacteroidetes bacterium]|nr:insulinase family protein [Bacteroidota bacterium]
MPETTMRPIARALPRRLVLLAIFFAVIGATASAQIRRSPEKEFARFHLDNGLEVIVVQNNFVPIATIELAVRNGSFTEGPEYAGLSHLYEHMFFKANGEYENSQSFISALNSLGILYNATTREEVVYYYFTLPSANLEKGLEIMSNTVQTPRFDSVELEREREVVLGEFDRQESAPFFTFGRAMDSAMWGEYVVRKQPIGQRPVIKTATPEKMRTIQRKYYIPNNSLLIVGGDVDSAEIYPLVQKYFSSWKRGPDPFASDPPPQPKPLAEKKLVTVSVPGVDISQVEYLWHGPSVGIDNAATYAADVFIFILSQPQSRFQRKLVESGITQGAGINYYTQRYTGPISVQIATTPENTMQGQRALWDEIQAFDSPDYFTDEELATAKQILRMRALYESEETSDWVHTPAFWWSTTGLDYYIGYIDNLAKVTRADVQNYVRKYIKGKNYVLGIASNPQTMAKLNVKPSEVLK